jgi:methionyl-tRNA formyltransferase
MKVAVLTTETLHHAFFVRSLLEVTTDLVAFCETSVPSAPFPTRHAFEDERDAYESQRWFAGRSVAVADLVPTRAVPSMNDEGAVAALEAVRPDAVIVFGTGMLRGAVIGACRGRIFNLHGGDPEEYRGLDTHLWAIFHRDFAGLVTTLHRVDEGLDTGDIVGQKRLHLTAGMRLHALRSVNTEACVTLVQTALRDLAADGDVASRKQRRKGRYYSAMPADLKTVCVDRFDAYVRRLDDAGP